jgi:hypothetical protein
VRSISASISAARASPSLAEPRSIAASRESSARIDSSTGIRWRMTDRGVLANPGRREQTRELAVPVHLAAR